MKNYDISLHVKGQSQFVDDVSLPAGALYACVFAAPAARGLIKHLEIREALATEGVEVILSCSDIPG
ncbi:hypothetical protein RZS08_64735, partial [Arthrospira platensis SPKY1]|nr:hypothetical protein [Arthrospira platensis SPKY1]